LTTSNIQLVKWVAGSILALPTIKERAQQIERYVEVAKV